MAAMILLHSPGGAEILINPQMVTSLRARIEDEPNKVFTDEVQCMIALADGKFVTVVEHCDIVRKLVEEQK
jgi:hypothetical protein